MAEIVTKARDAVAKLKNPRTKFQIINKLDTEEINRLKARYAYIKRKEFLFELLTSYENNPHNDQDEHRSDWSSSPCSELNFQNDGDPSTPRPTSPIDGAELDSSTETIYMGDYENRIRPSPNYWYNVDGRNLAEKIIYYRTYRLQSSAELESTLREFPRSFMGANAINTIDNKDSSMVKEPTNQSQMKTTPTIIPGSKSARPKRNKPSFEVDERPSSVPPDFAKNSHHLPPPSNRKSATPLSQKKSRQEPFTPVFLNKTYDESKADRQPTSVNDVHLADETDNKTNKSITEEQIKEDVKNHKQAVNKEKEEISLKELKKSSKSKTKTNDTRKKVEREHMKTIEENNLITKLDKKIEKDLKALQGIKDDDDCDDGDDDELDDDALDDILNGQMNTDIDEFLKIR